MKHLLFFGAILFLGLFVTSCNKVDCNLSTVIPEIKFGNQLEDSDAIFYTEYDFRNCENEITNVSYSAYDANGNFIESSHIGPDTIGLVSRISFPVSFTSQTAYVILHYHVNGNQRNQRFNVLSTHQDGGTSTNNANQLELTYNVYEYTSDGTFVDQVPLEVTLREISKASGFLNGTPKFKIRSYSGEWEFGTIVRTEYESVIPDPNFRSDSHSISIQGTILIPGVTNEIDVNYASTENYLLQLESDTKSIVFEMHDANNSNRIYRFVVRC